MAFLRPRPSGVRPDSALHSVAGFCNDRVNSNDRVSRPFFWTSDPAQLLYLSIAPVATFHAGYNGPGSKLFCIPRGPIFFGLPSSPPVDGGAGDGRNGDLPG